MLLCFYSFFNCRHRNNERRMINFYLKALEKRIWGWCNRDYQQGISLIITYHFCSFFRSCSWNFCKRNTSASSFFCFTSLICSSRARDRRPDKMKFGSLVQRVLHVKENFYHLLSTLLSTSYCWLLTLLLMLVVQF